MNLKFIGAAQTVTGSKIEFEYRGFRGLIDCGLYQGPKELRELNWSVLENVKDYKCVLLTHAHIDHSGYLPKLVLDGFQGPIYCSEGTAALAKILLLDAAKLQEEDAKYANDSKHSNHDPALPLYEEEDALAAIEKLQIVPLQDWQVLAPDLSFRLIRSGHILGSTFIQMSFMTEQGPKIITFSGDVGGGRSEVIREPDLLNETDWLVCESTYGDRMLPPFDPKQLADAINKVYNRGGTLIIPAFAVGRTQELLYQIYQLELKGLIPDVPVYVDSPMAQKVTALYSNFTDELKLCCGNEELEMSLSTRNFKATVSSDDSMLLCMSTEPKIVISASGMLQGGRVLHHLRTKLPDENSGVLFVGYQGEGTKGRLLKNGLRSIRIHHINVEVNAEIFIIESLSAHADSEELMTWMKGFVKPPEKVFLVHGEETSLRALYYRVTNELGWECEIPAPNEEFKLF